MIQVGCNLNHQNESVFNEETENVKGDFDSEKNRTTLSLKKESSQDDTLVVSVEFVNNDQNKKPRIAEYYIKHTGNVEYLSFEKGNAVYLVQKDMVVQKKSDGFLRTVVFSSSNLNTLDSGTIATYTFKRLDDGEVTFEILTDKPIFAPSEANEGLLVGDPLSI